MRTTDNNIAFEFWFQDCDKNKFSILDTLGSMKEHLVFKVNVLKSKYKKSLFVVFGVLN